MYYKIFEHSYSSTLHQSNSKTPKHLYICTPNHSTFTSKQSRKIFVVFASVYFFKVSFSTVPSNVHISEILSLNQSMNFVLPNVKTTAIMSKPKAISVSNTHFSLLIFSMFQVQYSIGQSATMTI